MLGFKISPAAFLCVLITALSFLSPWAMRAEAKKTIDPAQKVNDQTYVDDKGGSSLSAQTNGHHYINRDRTFDPTPANIQRMERGLAPIGKDGKPVQIHHFQQKSDAKRVEVTKTEHGKIRHDKMGGSEIDRMEFARERRQHWKERAAELKR